MNIFDRIESVALQAEKLSAKFEPEYKADDYAWVAAELRRILLKTEHLQVNL